MKKLFLIVLCVLIVSVPLSAETWMKGVIIRMDGKILVPEAIRGDTELWGKFQDTKLRIRFDKLLVITFLKHNPMFTSDIEVINLKERAFIIKDTSLVNTWNKYGGVVTYQFYDPINDKIIERTIARKKILQIILDYDRGDLKQNPKTGRYYPVSFNVDPVTGEKLIWASIDEHMIR